ncbi:MAG: PH domain-containing protein [Candidatus Microsaccharimonas sp.]
MNQVPNDPQPSNDTPPHPIVHVARPIEPEQLEVSPERQKLHERSRRLYPFLNLSKGEYVIAAVRRHPIGIILPLAVGTLLIAAALSVLANYDIFSTTFQITGPLETAESIAVPILAFVGIVVLYMAVAYYVYTNNKFFLTNESVIQEIQTSLFSRQEQTVSLANIEDASFTQHGILQQILDYGDIRLSTEGDETTYRFSYVASPKNHIERLNNAVEAFKNGRPVDDN